MTKLPRTHQTREARSAPQRAHPVAPARAAAPRHLAQGAIVQRAMAAPRSLRPAELISMQRTIGNRAVGMMLGRAPVQTKLTVNAPQDEYEREADRVAQDVLRTPTTPCEETPGQQISQVIISRPGAVQSGDGSFAAGEDFAQRLQASQGQGRPLPPTLRETFETKFGADFSGVRIHSGEQASQLSHDIQAQAFTHGSDIFLRASNYAPGTATGKRLLAHELSHVVQQGAARPKMPPGVALASAPVPISPSITAGAGPGGSAGSMSGSKPAMIQRTIRQYKEGRWQVAELGTRGNFGYPKDKTPVEGEYFNDVNNKHGQTIDEVRAGLSDLMMIQGSLADKNVNLSWPDTIWDALVEMVPEKIQLDNLNAQLNRSRANLNIDDANARARHTALLERRDAASRREALGALVKLGTVTLSPPFEFEPSLPPPPARLEPSLPPPARLEPSLPPPERLDTPSLPPLAAPKPRPALNMKPMALFDNTENIDFLSKLWDRFLLPFMQKNGQLPYIQRQEWFNNHNANVEIDVQFYWNRAYEAALDFHKDTHGDNLFVNLIFNNQQEMPATEWIEDLTDLSTEKRENMKRLMPQGMIDEIDIARQSMMSGEHQLGEKGTIRGGTASRLAFVSWVDDLVWHATPAATSRMDVTKNYYDILIKAKDYWDKGQQNIVHKALAALSTFKDTAIAQWRKRYPAFSTRTIDRYLRDITKDQAYRLEYNEDIKRYRKILQSMPISLEIGQELSGRSAYSDKPTGISLRTRRANSVKAVRERVAQARENTAKRSFLRTWVRVRKPADFA